MNKLFLLLALSFFIFGIALSFPIIIAGEDDNNSGSSNSDSDNQVDEKDEDKDDEDRSGKEGRFREEIKLEFIDEDGNRVKIERKVEIKDGEIKIEIKRKIIDSDGTVVERIVIVERDEDGIKKRIKIKRVDGTGEFEVETELEIDDEFEGNESDLMALTSDGKKHRIKILPDRASEIAIERLKSKNFTIELKEILHKNIPRVVYNIETNKNGKFLGVFKLKVKIEGEIDSETGEVLNINKPWWAFLVVGEDSDQIGEENQITVELTEENGSGEFGTSMLVKENGQVIVTLSMIGAPENVSQPVHIHVGSCPEVGEVKYPLTNVLDGESVTTLDVTLEQLEIELPLAINVHKSVTEASVYVSCGDIQF